ncbi:probable rRNA-processing protein EBP2 homolog [Ricinus communis]|uniref:rRNA-processing protein EBP2, putative n=1 Tax=Ricinus communis TaxID=3988 RepID=B9SKC1_RICCO|nr:probable rRNA-processing protein EBP2 homolog [Ricinus communis]EEF35935.1 rRNA-processing protein EBP2, putative [Ricinus communis]|eukprot:XP_002526440.1 probable rRNA-processing protein EBP2 homolog [Ricinus communis]
MGARDKDLTAYDEEPIDDEEIDNIDGDESDSEYESEPESESEEEDVKLSEPSKNAVYNRDALNDKLQDISWPENVSWIHKLSVDIEQEQEVDVNDDLARELAFYTQALEGTRKAFEKLETMGLPFLRPSDYYAEMVKSDIHMEKVKGRLLAEKRNIEEAEERRKARESKRLAKEIQAQKQKERAAQKKMEIENVKKWRKQRQQSGFAGGDKDGEMNLPFENGEALGRPNKRRPGVSPGDRSGGKSRQDWKKGSKKGFENKQNKRDARDSRFGYGGRKGLKKQNTADTTGNLRGFNKGGLQGNKKRKR